LAEVFSVVENSSVLEDVEVEICRCTGATYQRVQSEIWSRAMMHRDYELNQTRELGGIYVSSVRVFCIHGSQGKCPKDTALAGLVGGLLHFQVTRL
jgi:hypothetical protein